MKDTFIIRTEWFESISELDDTEQAMIFRNLFHFHNGEENLINLNNRAVKLVWKLLEPNLKRNIDSYDKRCDTSANNGKLGGRPKKQVEENLNNLNKPIQKPNYFSKPNETLNDSVIDSVIDSEPVIDSEIEIDTEIDTEEEKEKPNDTAAADVPDFVQANRDAVKPKPKITKETLKADLLENEYCQRSANKHGIKAYFENFVNEFIIEKFGLGENEKWKDLSDARSHFVRWIPYFKPKFNLNDQPRNKQHNIIS